MICTPDDHIVPAARSVTFEAKCSNAAFVNLPTPSKKITLTFWRLNYFFKILAHSVKNVNKTGTKYVRIMKQTAF